MNQCWEVSICSPEKTIISRGNGLIPWEVIYQFAGNSEKSSEKIDHSPPIYFRSTRGVNVNHQCCAASLVTIWLVTVFCFGEAEETVPYHMLYAGNGKARPPELYGAPCIGEKGILVERCSKGEDPSRSSPHGACQAVKVAQADVLLA